MEIRLFKSVKVNIDFDAINYSVAVRYLENNLPNEDYSYICKKGVLQFIHNMNLFKDMEGMSKKDYTFYRGNIRRKGLTILSKWYEDQRLS